MTFEKGTRVRAHRGAFVSALAGTVVGVSDSVTVIVSWDYAPGQPRQEHTWNLTEDQR